MIHKKQRKLKKKNTDSSEQLVDILLSVSGINILGAVYCGVLLIYEVTHGEFGAMEHLDLQYTQTPLPVL